MWASSEWNKINLTLTLNLLSFFIITFLFLSWCTFSLNTALFLWRGNVSYKTILDCMYGNDEFTNFSCLCRMEHRYCLNVDNTLWRFRIFARLSITLCGFVITFCDFGITLGGFRITLCGFGITLCGFRITLWRFRITLCGFLITFCGFAITLGGFRMTLCGFGITLCGFGITLCGFVITFCGYGIT